ncbi:hypothetical protein IMY05_C4703000200 [Salix suchowensis]|nr:hypothetical protein IMY05_C4703000200 [Salix suchowensis]
MPESHYNTVGYMECSMLRFYEKHRIIDGNRDDDCHGGTKHISSGVPTPTTTAPQRSSGVNAGAIAGGVVGGVAFLTIVAVIGFWYSLRRKQRNDGTEVNVFESHLPTSPTTPYNTAVGSGSVMRETPGHRSQQGSIVSLNTYSPPITVSHSHASNRSDYYLKSHTGSHEFEQLFHVSNVAYNIGCLYDLRPEVSTQPLMQFHFSHCVGHMDLRGKRLSTSSDGRYSQKQHRFLIRWPPMAQRNFVRLMALYLSL